MVARSDRHVLNLHKMSKSPPPAPVVAAASPKALASPGKVQTRNPVLLTLIGVALSFALYFWEKEKDLRNAQGVFEDAVADISTGLARRADSNVQVLRGVAGLFKANDRITRAEFGNYYQELKIDRLYPGIQGIGFAQWLPKEELAAHVDKIRAEGFPEYSVRPINNGANQSSIVYLEPFDWRNQRAFGYNMFSESTRQEAMRRSVITDQPALSDRVTLLQETEADVQAGFLIYIPVFAKNMPTATEPERWRALMGWAYSPLRATNLIQSFLLDEHPTLFDQVDIRIFSSITQDWSKLLYQSEPGLPIDEDFVPVSRTIDLYGSKWLVMVSPRTGFWKNELQRLNNIIVLLVCLAGSLMLGYFFFAQSRRNQSVSAALIETTRAKQELEENESSLRLSGVVMEASPTGIFVADPMRTLITTNPAFNTITGMSDKEALMKPVEVVLGGVGPGNLREFKSIWSDLQRLGLWRGELSFRRADGSVYPCDASITRVKNGANQVSHYVGMLTDISDRRKDEERIRYLAHHDYLTGLPNRALFVERAESAILAASRYQLRPAMLFIDLDRFKPVNDEHGHEIGDAVLKQVAERLKVCVRQTDLVCRLGGDEFVVITPDHKDKAFTMSLAEQLCDEIAKPYVIGAKRIVIGASVGIAHYPDDGRTVDELISNSDRAMYQAKSDPTARVHVAASSP